MRQSKTNLRAWTSKSASVTESTSRHIPAYTGETSIRSRPRKPISLPPGKCPRCFKSRITFFKVPDSCSLIFRCGHLLCSSCKWVFDNQPEVTCREILCKKTVNNESVKTLYLLKGKSSVAIATAVHFDLFWMDLFLIKNICLIFYFKFFLFWWDCFHVSLLLIPWSWRSTSS